MTEPVHDLVARVRRDHPHNPLAQQLCASVEAEQEKMWRTFNYNMPYGRSPGFRYRDAEAIADRPCLTMREFGERMKLERATVDGMVAGLTHSQNRILADMHRNMKPLTLLERLELFYDRARDAWRVLTGKATVF